MLVQPLTQITTFKWMFELELLESLATPFKITSEQAQNAAKEPNSIQNSVSHAKSISPFWWKNKILSGNFIFWLAIFHEIFNGFGWKSNGQSGWNLQFLKSVTAFSQSALRSKYSKLWWARSERVKNPLCAQKSDFFFTLWLIAHSKYTFSRFQRQFQRLKISISRFQRAPLIDTC